MMAGSELAHSLPCGFILWKKMFSEDELGDPSKVQNSRVGHSCLDPKGDTVYANEPNKT